MQGVAPLSESRAIDLRMRSVSQVEKSQIFLVAGIKNPTAIAEKMRELEVKFCDVSDDSWLAVFSGTTREFAERLGIRSGEIGASGLVVPVENYSGRAAGEVWEWLKVNWPQND